VGSGFTKGGLPQPVQRGRVERVVGVVLCICACPYLI